MQPMTEPFRDDLEPGERILWQGQPNRRRYLLRGCWAIPFSLLWCGFAVFWEVSVFRTNAPFFFRLWGLAFVLIGLYLVFGRFFVAVREAERTWYAVTNRRILIRSGGFRQELTELDLRRLPALQFSDQGAGVGTITFGSPNPYGAYALPGWPGTRAYRTPAFVTIDDAREVHDIIRQAVTNNSL